MGSRSVATLELLLLALFTSLLLASQSTSKDSPEPAANAWMLIPTPYLAWNEGVSPSIRAQRDHYWDKISMSDRPVTAPGAGSISSEGGDDLTVDQYDIPNIPNRVILTATFTEHSSVLSASEYSLYSEITLQVDRVFEDRSGSGRPFANARITAIVYGGTVFLRSGERFSVHVEPKKLFLQPRHKYLLVLSYHKEGDFCGYDESWDISDGTVRPNTSRIQYLAESQHSKLSGVSAKQIGAVLNKELYAHDTAK